MMTQTTITFITKELLAFFTEFAEPDTKVDEFINRIKTQNINLAKKRDDYHSLAFVSGEIKNPKDYKAYIEPEDLVDLTLYIIQKHVMVIDGYVPTISQVTEVIRKYEYETYVVTDEAGRSIQLSITPKSIK